MKAIVFTKYGPPDVLELKDVPKPTPEDDEVLIRTIAATVIAGDCEFRSFKFPLWFWIPLRMYSGLLKPKRINILGQELAGEIETVGANVKRFQPGDQVFGATAIGLGGYAEYKCLDESMALAIKPDNMTFGEAAAVPTGGLNALHYLRQGQLKRGERILINGAAGNIGGFAVQLAKHFGAEVTAVDSAAKLELLRSIGADHVIDYAREDFTKNGQTYDVIFDVVGKSSFSRCLKSLNDNGRLVLANPRPSQMLRGLITPLLSSKKVLFKFAPYRAEDLDFLKELIEAGELKSVIDRSYPLEKTAEAHRHFETGNNLGNIVLTIDGNCGSVLSLND